MRGTDHRCTRRASLRWATVASAIAATGGLAGCLDAVGLAGGDETDVEFGPVQPPEPAAPDYRRWVPTVAAVSDDERTRQVTRRAATLAVRPSEPGEPALGQRFRPRDVSRLQATLDFFGRPFEGYDRVVRVTGAAGYVLEGDLDPAAVAGTLTGSGYEAAGTHEGYDLFRRTDNARTVGVSEGAIVFTRGVNYGRGVARDHRIDDEAVVRAIVDAGEGLADRRADTDDAYRALTDRVGRSPYVSIDRLGDPGRATAVAFDGEVGYVVVRWLYPSGEAPSVETLRERLATGQEISPRLAARARRAERVDVTADGSVATVAMRLGPDALAAETPHESVPTVTWGVAYDAASDRLLVRHDGGDSVPTRDLSTAGPAFEDHEQSIRAQMATLEPGDALTIDLGDVPAQTPVFTLTYDPFEGGQPVPLFRYVFEERRGDATD